MKQFLKTTVHTPVEFISGGQFVSNRAWTHTKRIIDSYEIIIGVNKTLYIQQDDIQYEVNPGDILLLIPYHTHLGYAACTTDISFYWFHFLCPYPTEIIDEKAMAAVVSTIRSDPFQPVPKPHIFIPFYSRPANIERINILFNQLLDVANADYYTHHAVNYLATVLLIELSQQTITSFQTASLKAPTDQNLAKILEWIRIHAMNQISVSSIAKEFSYNRDYLSRFFKQKTGMNIKAYIHMLKMNKAKDLLTRTNQSIKEIAYTVGIYDEKYFMKLFKKYEKVTPTEFRKAYYRTHMNNK